MFSPASTGPMFSSASTGPMLSAASAAPLPFTMEAILAALEANNKNLRASLKSDLSGQIEVQVKSNMDAAMAPVATAINKLEAAVSTLQSENSSMATKLASLQASPASSVRASSPSATTMESGFQSYMAAATRGTSNPVPSFGNMGTPRRVIGSLMRSSPGSVFGDPIVPPVPAFSFLPSPSSNEFDRRTDPVIIKLTSTKLFSADEAKELLSRIVQEKGVDMSSVTYEIPPVSKEAIIRFGDADVESAKRKVKHVLDSQRIDKRNWKKAHYQIGR